MRKYAVIAALAAVLFVSACGKPIHLFDKGHSSENFRFEDYRSHPDDIAGLFPRGTKRFFVEKILVEIGHASTQEETDREVLYVYRTGHIFTWSCFVTVNYDDEDRVKDVSTTQYSTPF